MKRVLGLFTVVLLLSSVGPAQAARKTVPQGRSDTSATIQRLEAELRLAILKHEPSWFDEHLAETYTEIDAQGNVHSRADSLQFYRSPELSVDTYNLSEGTARTFNGDLVILTGKIEVHWTVKDQGFSGNFRFTRIWVKRGANWELAGMQQTRIPG